MPPFAEAQDCVDNERRSIESIDRAIDIILLLKRQKREMGVTEIANELDLYKSTRPGPANRYGRPTAVRQYGTRWLRG